VIAAAVLFEAPLPPALRERIDDSKRLDASTRETLYEALGRHARFGVGAASVAEIDALNILNATHLAMRRAFEALPVAPGRAVVDGNRLPALPCAAEAVVGGDRLVLEVAAASIIAKVTRDRLMAALAARHPGYGWERNKGYGTAEHSAALRRLGPSPHHRRSFAPVRVFLEGS
jgi:ribonuclease HII